MLIGHRLPGKGQGCLHHTVCPKRTIGQDNLFFVVRHQLQSILMLSVHVMHYYSNAVRTGGDHMLTTFSEVLMSTLLIL